MKKLLGLIILFMGQFLFYACSIAHEKRINCADNFKKSRDLAYEYPDYPPGLDSALVIANMCMECDSIRTAVVELKIRLLLSLGRFKEGSLFIDSLKASDFIYPYKRKLFHDNFMAQNFASRRDTISHDELLRKMFGDLEDYINTNNLESKEFQEAFIDLNNLSDRLKYTGVLLVRIDSLRIKYPEESKFLDFFNQ
jgi:hypothetical protein